MKRETKTKCQYCDNDNPDEFGIVRIVDEVFDKCKLCGSINP